MSGLLLSETNVILDATRVITFPATDTPAEYLQNSYAARRAKWTNLIEQMAINFYFDDGNVDIDYVAITASNLLPTAELRVSFFNESDELLYLTDFTEVRDLTSIEDSENAVIFWRLQQRLSAHRINIQVRHGYDYVPPTETTSTTPPVVTTTTVSDGIPMQDESGTLSLEAENGAYTDAGLDMILPTSENGASNGQFIRKSQTTFYSNANAGPRSSFEFTASQNGAHDLWLRVRTASSKNSLYSIFDGASGIHIMPSNYSVWTWHRARTITLTADTRHTIAIAARDNLLEIDKIVLLPAGSAVPDGIGPEQSAEGTTTITTVTEGDTVTTFEAGSSDSVEIRSVMAGRLMTLDKNFEQNAGASFMTQPDIQFTHSGRSVLAREQRQSRRMTLTLPEMTPSDRQKIAELERRLAGAPFIVSAFPDEEPWRRDAYLFLGRFGDSLNYGSISDTIHTTQLEIVEA